MDDRLDLANGFLRNAGWGAARIAPLAGDASARRYFRLTRGSAETAVLMDAPPADGQEIAPFAMMAEFLSGLGLSAPRILASDRDRGFLLLEDLGDALFACVIEADPQMEMILYQAAADVLVSLDRCDAGQLVPRFDAATMAAQVAPFFEWYLGNGGDRQKVAVIAALETVLQDTFEVQPTLLLRDFHAENLIWLPEREGLARVGLLDFQDAMTGPAGYDLVSLLQDARRDVSPGVADAIVSRFASATGRDPGPFSAALAAIGAQRNLRILGVFARLAQRDGKARYLEFMPRVWGYVRECLAHPALAQIAELLKDGLQEPDQAFLKTLEDRCQTIPR